MTSVLTRGPATRHQFASQTASDRELLAQLIGARESQRLYKGSLQPFFGGCVEPTLSTKCLVAKELVKRWLKEDLRRRSALTSPSAVSDLLKIHFAGREYESFVVLYLDAQNGLIEIEEMFRGTLTQTAVYPREIAKSALRTNAAGVIFSHNHPSGSPHPSRADETLTQTLKSTLALLDIRVLDHLVIAGNVSLSFAERGLL